MVWLTVPIVAEVVVACDAARRDAWDRARAPGLSRHCDLLAQALAAIDVDPARAEAAAAEADKLAPGRAAPLVLLARAAAAAERFAEAVELFRRARAIDARAGDDAASLASLAVALERTGDRKGAVAAYRALVPMAPALSGARRTRARIAAGLAILGEGPDAAGEAIAVLRTAARDAAPDFAALADAALALALDRRGSVGEARALAERAASSGALAELSGLGRDDTLAVTAMLREPGDLAKSTAAWEAFLALAPAGPWAAHARAKLAEHKPRAATRHR